MSNSSLNNKSIAKNTMYMYIRMGVIMLVQLYTSRVVLNALGVDDYGIYNIVGALIVAFSFVSGPLSAATQRFLNFEIGKNDNQALVKVFNMSVYLYLIMAAILFVGLEIGGVWYIDNKMNIPVGRETATHFVFQLSIISFIISLIKTPFDSLVIAYEKMSYYALVSVIEALLKLGNAMSLVWFGFDKLKLYASNQLIISIVIILCVVLFCKKKFTAVHLQRVWDKDMFKALFSFSGWTLFSSVATMGANQGVNMVVNFYTNVAVNAAMGIAYQVSSSINQFVTNFQVAYNPQLVKSYSSGELKQMRTLIYRASKFSYLLLFALVCPLCFNIDYVLKIWLKTPPEYTSIFCIYLMMWALLESLMAPLWVSITATGKIKHYHITMSIIISFVFFGSWLSLHLGFAPESVMIVKCLIDVVLLFTRLLFAKNLVGLSFWEFNRTVFVPIGIISLIFIVSMLQLVPFLGQGFSRLLLSVGIFEILFIPCVFKLALNKKEQSVILSSIRNKMNI